MKKVWYLPTVDEANKPLVVKVKVIGERDGWRMLHQLGVPYKGELITARGLSSLMKEKAKTYRMETNVVYPHSFRHRFAKNFLERYNDIAFLADLMGHSSIETTRIYLRKTATEQREIMDRAITW